MSYAGTRLSTEQHSVEAPNLTHDGAIVYILFIPLSTS